MLRKLGGGILSGGAAQEEVLFCKCPELLSTCLIVEQLGALETVIVVGE